MQGIKNMFSKDNPNNIRRECGYGLRFLGIAILAILAISGLYFVGVGIAIGITNAGKEVGYNFTTGCPDNMETCANNIRLGCYAGNMGLCYGRGFVGMIGIVLSIIVLIPTVAIIMHFICVCKKSYNTSMSIVDTTKNTHVNIDSKKDIELPNIETNDIEIPLDSTEEESSGVGLNE